MRYSEFSEARAHADRYDQTRGLSEVLGYLKKFTEPQLKSMFVHASAIPKVGLKPIDNVLLDDDPEPVGIYTYRADRYLRWWGKGWAPDYGSSLPYVHIITLKSNVKILGVKGYEEYIKKLKTQPQLYTPSASTRPKKEYEPSFSPAKVNFYFRKLGYGVVQRAVEESIEDIILGTEYIQSVKTFQTTTLPKDTKITPDFDGEFEYGFPLTALSTQHRDFLKKYNMHWDLPINIDWDKNVINTSNPRILPAVKLLLNAIITQRELDPKSLELLKKNDLTDVYKKYVLNKEPLKFNQQRV